MKKVLIASAMCCLLLSETAFAGSTSPLTLPGIGRFSAEPIPISGKLSLVHGDVAIEIEGRTYFILGLKHYLGRIEGLSIGSEVTVEGWAKLIYTTPQYIVVEMTRLSFSGKDYLVTEHDDHDWFDDDDPHHKHH